MSLINSFLTVGILELFSLLCAVLVASVSKNQEVILPRRSRRPLRLLREFRIWRVLTPSVLPAIVIGVLLSSITAAIGTVGGLLGEQLFDKNNLDWLIIFVHNLPFIFGALFLTKIKIKNGKKRISHAVFILAAICLIAINFFRNNSLLVVVGIFLASLFVAIAWILNEAVFSDLTNRTEGNKLHINSLERVNDSLGYLIGPILIGFLADKTDYMSAFSILGLLFFVVGVGLLFFTPKKLLLPQKKLRALQ